MSAELAVNLAFGTAGGLGGTERRMLDVVAELRSRGVAVRSWAPAPLPQPLHTAMAEAGAEVIAYATPLDLLRRVARSGATVTWAFGARTAYPLAVGRRLPRWGGGRLWVAKNGLEALRSGPSTLVERVFIRSADLVVANSHAAARHAATWSRARPERVRVVPSALSDEWTTPHERTSGATVRIAMIGNDRPEKQHALGVRFYALLHDPAASLEVYTNDGNRLRAQVAGLPLDVRQRVSIHEGVSITPEVMRSVDVLLHPSSSESLPRVALEARSQGAWVVGFDVGDLARYAQATIAWGDEAGLADSLRDACAAVHRGERPEVVEILAVPDYVDRLLELITEPSAPGRWGTAR